MKHLDGARPPIISSLSELEGEVICWTFFAGRPLGDNDRSSTRNTIQLPELHEVVLGKLEAIFHPENWIGDKEEPEWRRAEEILLQRRMRCIWSPVTIRCGSILLGPGVPPESDVDGEIYRHEGIIDVRGGSNPENMFYKVRVQRFIEKSQ